MLAMFEVEPAGLLTESKWNCLISAIVEESQPHTIGTAWRRRRHFNPWLLNWGSRFTGLCQITDWRLLKQATLRKLSEYEWKLFFLADVKGKGKRAKLKRGLLAMHKTFDQKSCERSHAQAIKIRSRCQTASVELLAEAQKIKAKLKKKQPFNSLKINDGRTFGSITNKRLQKSLRNNFGIKIDKRHIQFSPIVQQVWLTSQKFIKMSAGVINIRVNEGQIRSIERFFYGWR